METVYVISTGGKTGIAKMSKTPPGNDRTSMRCMYTNRTSDQVVNKVRDSVLLLYEPIPVDGGEMVVTLPDVHTWSIDAVFIICETGDICVTRAYDGIEDDIDATEAYLIFV